MRKITLFALSVICALALVLGFSFRDSSVNKAYAAEGYVAGANPTIGSTMFKISTDGSALLLATAIEYVDDIYQVGYDITVSTGDVDGINVPTNRYYSSITLGAKTWYPSEIFGEDYSEAKMIIWEIGYNPSYTYTIKAYAYVGYRSQSDGQLYPAQGNEDFPDIKVEQATANRLSQSYTLSFENGAEEIDDKVVTIGSAIGTLPAISDKVGYDADCWKIGETTITTETVWNWYSDKTAVAAYTAHPIHDNSNTFAADFLMTSDADYTVTASAIGVADIDDIVAVKLDDDGSDLTYSLDSANDKLVFGNDYVKAKGVGDYIIDVYTATDTYKIKVALVTDVITSVEGLNAMAAYGAANETAHTGYYILGADIDGGTLTEPLSGYCANTNYTTNGFRGIFDGRGHVISNLTLPSASGYKNRFFNGLGEGAIVRNLAFIDPIQTGSLDFVFANQVQGATISNVLVKIDSDKAAAVYAMAGTFNGAKIEKSVFIMEGGQSIIAQKDDNSESAASTISDLVIVVGDPTNREIVEGGIQIPGLCGAAYKVEEDSYDEFKSNHNITEYASINALITALASDDFIADLDSSFITYANKAIRFDGAEVVTPVIALTAPSAFVYAGGTLTFTAVSSTLSLRSSIEGVTFNASNGVLSVGAGVAADTEITVRATSTVDANRYEELTVTVDYVPEDLTGSVKDIELGQSFSVAGISGSVIAIKGSAGKVTLASANVVTASELNTATGKECGEDIEVTLYTATSSYLIRGNFITKIIRTVADLKAIAAYGTANRNAHTGYYILGNDIDGTGQDSVNALSNDMPDHDNYTTLGFRGILDGRGHTLKNLRLQEGMLFWGIGNNGVVKNLALIDPVQVTSRAYALTRNITHGTISNVIVKAGCSNAILFTDCGAIIENSVFILDTNGTNAIANKDDTFGGAIHTPTVLNNVVVVVKSNSGTLTALFGTDYKPSGESYAEYVEAHNIKDYATINAMFTALESEDFIAGWDALITYDDGICLCGNKIVKPVIALTAPSNIVYAGNSMTLSATDATFSLAESVSGVSINSSTGVLTVGAGVAADTSITVRATSTIVTGVYEEVTVTVDYAPVDLVSDGIKDIELGSAISVANVSGNVIAIKTASGSKVTLATPNVVTASELNTAAGVNWSEDLAITLYTASNAYSVRAAFITKIIRTVADFNIIGANDASRNTYATSYLVLGNDIDGADQANVNALSVWCGGEDAGFRGVFDGRGHVLKNLKLKDGYFFWGLGKCTLKNFALIDPVQVASANYVLASGVHHATITNVIVKANSKLVFGSTFSATEISNSVFIIVTNGTSVVGQKDDMTGKVASGMHDVVAVVGTNSGTITALYGTAYKVDGTYAEYEAANNIKDYATINAMFTALESDDFIADWDAQITYDDGICLNGAVVIKPVIALTAPSNEIYAGNSMTLTATDATFSLAESVSGVSVNSSTGVLTVGAGVAADTEITVRATSTIVTGVYEEVTITVALEPVDLTSDGIKDIELGSAISVANVSGNVLAIKTASGSKVVLATPNVVTASELNTAAGVNYSEDLEITLYTASSAYSVRAAFITRIIRNISDLKAAANYCQSDRDKNPVYYILANDIDGSGQGKVAAFSYNSTTSTNYTTAGFRGIFDGRGHILKNIELNDNRMFWGIGNNGVVKNFALIDPVFTSTPCILARDVVHGTISNVVVKSSAGSAFIGIACGATIEKCVFILEPNGTYVMNDKDDLSGNAASSINNVAIVVSSNSGTLKAVANNVYKPSGATYAEFVADNNIYDYSSSSALLTALSSSNFITSWSSPYISYADGHLKFNGTTVV